MARLGDVIKIKPSTVSLKGERIWLLNLDMVEQQTGRVFEHNFVNVEDLDGSIVQFDEDAVLYSKLRPNLNKVVLPDMAGFATSEMLPLMPDTAVLTREYLAYFLRSDSFVTWAVSKTAGAKMPRLGSKELLSKEIPLPTLGEQFSIAQQFVYVDTLISLRKQQLAKLDELVKSRFVEMFGDCQNEALIGDVISISRGTSPRPISAFITDRDDGVNWIKIGDVSENSLYITKTEEKITPEGAKKSRMVHKGDFILSNSMSFGRPYILGINGCVHDGWLIMSDFKETFNELYLYHAIRSDDVQYQFSGKVNGATVKNLNSDLVKNTFIKVPSMELQNQFAAFVEQTDKSKLSVQQSIDQLETLKKSLMQKYFG